MKYNILVHDNTSIVYIVYKWGEDALTYDVDANISQI